MYFLMLTAIFETVEEHKTIEYLFPDKKSLTFIGTK